MRVTAAAAVAVALAAGGCGSGPRQDADEPTGNYRLEVTAASFPPKQSIAESSTLAISVRNADSKTAPDVAVTVETTAATAGESTVSFGQRSGDDQEADSARPVWILDSGPAGGDSAATNTWTLGRLAPNQSKTFRWRVTAVQAGNYTIDYRISPGLNGRARVAGGGRTQGSFKVSIAGDPVPARVDGNGNVVRGEEAGRRGSAADGSGDSG
jgi:hypothetical protein